MSALEGGNFQKLGGDQLMDAVPQISAYIPLPRNEIQDVFKKDPELKRAGDILSIVAQEPRVLGIVFYGRREEMHEFSVLINGPINPDAEADRKLLLSIHEQMFAFAGCTDGFAPRVSFLSVDGPHFDPQAFIEQHPEGSENDLIALMHFTE